MRDPKWTGGSWQKGHTYSTHNDPDRFWESTVLARGIGRVAVACGASQEEAEANADMVSSALNLYGALMDLDAHWMEDGSDPDKPESVAYFTPRFIARWKAIRAVLAKARGEAI